MKRVRLSKAAAGSLVRFRSSAAAITAKLERYAETGAGDVVVLAGGDGAKRLRAGDFRIIFIESDDEISVTEIGHRSSIYK